MPVNQLSLLMEEVHYIVLILIWTHQGGYLATMVIYSLQLHLQLVNQDLEMMAPHLTSRMSHRFWRVSVFALHTLSCTEKYCALHIRK
jgi:hypothetical protein